MTDSELLNIGYTTTRVLILEWTLCNLFVRVILSHNCMHELLECVNIVHFWGAGNDNYIHAHSVNKYTLTFI